MKNLLLTLITFAISLTAIANNEKRPFQVEVSGQGQALILIPGFTVPGEIWDPLVKDLQKNYQCHQITLAGFAGTEPIDFPWLPQINEAIKEYILKNNLKNPIIIGHSLGGTMATWLAAQEELPISKIILIDALPATGALMFPDYNPDKLVYESPFNTQQLNMDSASFKQMASSMSKGMSNKPNQQERIKNWIMESDRKTYVYGYTDYLKLDLRDELAKIKIPVFIIGASEPYGKDMATNTFKSQYKNLVNYELIIAENSAHFVMLDQPVWFAKQIQSILSAEK